MQYFSVQHERSFRDKYIDKTVAIQMLHVLSEHKFSLERAKLMALDEQVFAELFQRPESRPSLDPRWKLSGSVFVKLALELFRSWFEFLKAADLLTVAGNSKVSSYDFLTNEVLREIVLRLHAHDYLVSSSSVSRLKHAQLAQLLEPDQVLVSLVKDNQLNGQIIVNRVKRLGFQFWADFLAYSKIRDAKARGQMPAHVMDEFFLRRVFAALGANNLPISRTLIAGLSNQDLLKFTAEDLVLKKLVYRYLVSGKDLLAGVKKNYGGLRVASQNLGFEYEEVRSAAKKKARQERELVGSQDELVFLSDGVGIMSRLSGRPTLAPLQIVMQAELVEAFEKLLGVEEAKIILERLSDFQNLEQLANNLSKEFPDRDSDYWLSRFKMLSESKGLESFFGG